MSTQLSTISFSTSLSTSLIKMSISLAVGMIFFSLDAAKEALLCHTISQEEFYKKYKQTAPGILLYWKIKQTVVYRRGARKVAVLPDSVAPSLAVLKD